MTNTLNEVQLSQIVGAVLKALQTQGAAPKVASVSAPTDRLAQRHAAILAGFKRKGFKDAKLFTDIKPFKGWMAEGRQVRRGERSIKGLFHRDQTDVIAKAKPAISAEQ